LGSTGIASGNLPADGLSWNGGGFVGTFISGSANPSVTGLVRLAAGDTLSFRNQANLADVVGIQHNSDDTVTVGGSAGVKTAGNLTVAGTMAATTVAGIVAATSITDSGNATITGTLASGATTVTGNLSVSGKLASYNGSTTVGVGVPYLVQSNIALTGQTAAITTANLVVGPPVPNMYRVSYYAVVTTTGNAVNLTVTIGWNDGITAKTLVSGNISCAAAGNSSASVTNPSPFVVYLGATQNLTYATALSGGIGAGAYALYIVTELIQ